MVGDDSSTSCTTSACGGRVIESFCCLDGVLCAEHARRHALQSREVFERRLDDGRRRRFGLTKHEGRFLGLVKTSATADTTGAHTVGQKEGGDGIGVTATVVVTHRRPENVLVRAAGYQPMATLDKGEPANPTPKKSYVYKVLSWLQTWQY